MGGRTERSFAVTHREPAREGRPVRATAEDSGSTGSASAFLPALAWYSLPLLSSLLPHFSVLPGTGSTRLLLPPGVCVCVCVDEGKRESEERERALVVGGGLGGSGGHASPECVCVRAATT